MDFDVKKLAKRFLICTKYFYVEERSYEQAFVLSLPEKNSSDPNISYLEEGKAPGVKVCHQDP